MCCLGFIFAVIVLLLMFEEKQTKIHYKHKEHEAIAIKYV